MSPPAEPLRDQLLVGISVSEPADSELIGRGLSQLHVRHAFVEIARHLLAAGHALAYGGDFRHQGYTEAMLDLVRTYSRREQPGPERILVYSAWPLWRSLDAEERAEVASVATLVEVDSPHGAPEQLPAARDRSPSDRFWAALALTKMRRQMNRDIGARVLLGGRVSGQAGLLPGVVEEAALSVEDALPLFVVGGFGGAASLVGSALRGDPTPELSVDYQQNSTSGYTDLWEEAERRGARPDFGELREALAQYRQTDRNRLSPEQDDRLFVTSDTDEIVALLLRGLRAIVRDQA